MDPTGRPIPTTGPIVHIDLVIWRRTITWADIPAPTSQKRKLPSQKVNSASSICFSLTCVTLCARWYFNQYPHSNLARFTCMSCCETYRAAVVCTTGAFSNHKEILSYYCFILNVTKYKKCFFCICSLEYYLENNELYRTIHNYSVYKIIISAGVLACNCCGSDSIPDTGMCRSK